MTEEIQLAAEAVTEIAEVTKATGGIGTLGINLKIFVAQLINFTVVLLVLWKWAYTPIIKLLDERAEKIEQSVKKADDIDQRVQELAAEQKTIITEAKSEASKIMDQTKVDADERRKVLLDKAKADVGAVVAQGKAQLQTEKENMISEARVEIGAIAVEAAKKILAEAVDEKKATKLAEDVVNEMV